MSPSIASISYREIGQQHDKSDQRVNRKWPCYDRDENLDKTNRKNTTNVDDTCADNVLDEVSLTCALVYNSHGTQKQPCGTSNSIEKQLVDNTSSNIDFALDSTNQAEKWWFQSTETGQRKTGHRKKFTTRKNKSKVKIAYNGFNYKYRGVTKKYDSYQARYYIKLPVTSTKRYF